MRIEATTEGYREVEVTQCKYESGLPDFNEEVLRVTRLRYEANLEGWSKVTLRLMCSKTCYIQVDIS